MTTLYTAVAANAGAERANVTFQRCASGDPGVAATFDGYNLLADEIAALKAKVAYLDDATFSVNPSAPGIAKSLLKITNLTGVGPYTPDAGAVNVASLTRTGSGASARLVVTYTTPIATPGPAFIIDGSGGVWAPDVVGTASARFKYFGLINAYTGAIVDFNAITATIYFAAFGA